MKNILDRIKRLDTVEEKIAEFGDIAIEVYKMKHREEKDLKKETRVELQWDWDSFRWPNICVIRISKGKENGETGNIEETMARIFQIW